MSPDRLSQLNRRLFAEFDPVLTRDISQPGAWVFDAHVVPLGKQQADLEAELFAGWHARLTLEDDRLQLQDVLVGISHGRSGNWRDIPMSPERFTQVWAHFKQTRTQLFNCFQENHNPYTEQMQFSETLN